MERLEKLYEMEKTDTQSDSLLFFKYVYLTEICHVRKTVKYWFGGLHSGKIIVSETAQKHISY
jgi:hypothetical protein